MSPLHLPARRLPEPRATVSAAAAVAVLILAAALAVLLAVTAAAPALAVEGADEEVELPASIEEVGEDNEVAQQFFPEEYEAPSLFAPILYPLLIAGSLIALVLLVLYLVWQPSFSRERDKVKGRR